MENGARSSTAVETTTSKALFSDNAMIGSVDMANYPEIELTVTRTKESITKLSETHRDLKKSEKVNGDSHSQVVRSEERNDDSLSDREGALVIDETPVEMKQKKRKRSVPSEFKGFKKRILAQASQITAKRATEKNTFSNDSIKKTANILGYNEKPVLTITKIPKTVSENFEKSSENEIEITRDSNTLNKFESGRKSTDDVEIIRENRPPEKPNEVKPKRSSKGTKQKKTEKVASNQKQEYAQYLGLQPALKFKCIRCGQSNFPSLADLNEHRQQCSAVGTSPAPTAPSPNSTNFKITRKVFLCSACGTYYEVWNLFLHMREVHHRHICLICLGLFSAAEKLSSHLSIKHDAPPKKYETVADFRSENEGQVFVMCVTCEKMFTESDDFSQHVCEINSSSKESSRTSGVKNRAKSVESSDPISTSHATAKVGSKAIQGEMRTNVIEKNVLKNNSKIHLSQKTVVSKNVSKIKNKILPSEHVTADTSLISSTSVEENIDEKCSSDNINRANIEIEKSSENVQIVSKEDLKIDHKTNDDTQESDKSKPENVESNQNNIEVQSKVVDNQENIKNLQKDTESISECEIKKDDNQSLNFDSVENSNDTNKKFYGTESQESSANKKLVSVKDDSDNTVNNLTDVCERFSDSNTTDNEKINLNDTINFEDKALETSEIKPNVCDNTCNISDETTNTSISLNSSIELSGENKREPDVMAFQTKINKCNEIDRKSNDILNQEDLLSVHTETNPDENIDKPDIVADKDFPVTLESPKETDESCKISEVINKQQIDAKSTLVNSPSDTISDTEELKSEIADCKYNQDLKAISDDKDLESEHLSVNAESSEESHEDNSESEDDSDDVADSEPVSDSRRVPKVTLRIPPRSKMDEETFQMDSDSDDSFKLTMEIDEKDVVDPDGSELDKVDPEKMNLDISEPNKIEEKDKESELKFERKNDRFPTAGPDVTVIELGVRPSLDKVTIQTLLKDFIHATCNTCAYCNHARKIAVNGKQLGLHMIAEHRFSAIADSITAEELLPETFVKHIEEHFEELRTKYFNLESYDDAEPEQMTPYDRTYECFRCRFVTTVHKELYLHNRKMHQKTILLCIMCKSTFYSYSELLCHLCPGNYTGAEVAFRCCLCPVDSIPSAFRLMVHLRKRHHACDVCLDACGDQSRLSNHVWKHKLHHLCYRCGIAYRNKPDITRHLFWKHGTESVLCKRCLSKKWPHVYHFCAPPLTFTCEDCGLSFTKAVALVVHRRLHTNAKTHACTEENCEQKFISKRLLERHINAHREPIPIDPPTLESEANASEEIKPKEIANEENHVPEVTAVTVEDQKEDAESKIKPVVDVYDLPALNLSESDSDSDDDDEKKQPEQMKSDSDLVKPKDSEIISENESVLNTIPEPEKPVPVVDGIWDDFKNYQASVEKRDFVLNEIDIGRSPLDRLAEAASLEALKVEASKEETVINKDGSILGSPEVVNCDHAYCAQIKPFKEEDESDEKNKENGEVDHDYCTSDKEQKENRTGEMDGEQTEKVKEKSKSPRKKNSGSSSSSSSSSDSDSSSCTCGSNCSCSSSNSGTSSSSSSNSDSGSSGSEGKRRAAARKQRRKERAKNRNKSSETVDVTVTDEPEKPLAPPMIPIEIHESDLYTTESETDEDFYDEHPHRFAKKLIEEKKNRLIMEAVSGDSPALNGNFIETSRSSTPNVIETPVEARKKSKVKSKKRKKNQKSIMRQQPENVASPPTSEIANYYDHSPVIPVNRSINVTPRPINMMVSRPSPGTLVVSGSFGAGTGGSGSETDGNLRSSKRRRVPNKFYGYSSDDDSTAVKPPEPPQLEWNKEDLPSPPRIAPLPVTPAPESSFVGTTWKRQIPEKQSSSDSDGDSDGLHIDKPLYPSIPVPPIPIPTDRQQLQQRPNENLYCYCQCPYDEVSEMIACDAKNCKIEWFHFECVGIMVPPKGKWYCPDCRNKQSSLGHPRPSEYFMS